MDKLVKGPGPPKVSEEAITVYVRGDPQYTFIPVREGSAKGLPFVVAPPRHTRPISPKGALLKQGGKEIGSIWRVQRARGGWRILFKPTKQPKPPSPVKTKEPTEPSGTKQPATRARRRRTRQRSPAMPSSVKDGKDGDSS